MYYQPLAIFIPPVCRWRADELNRTVGRLEKDVDFFFQLKQTGDDVFKCTHRHRLHYPLMIALLWKDADRYVYLAQSKLFLFPFLDENGGNRSGTSTMVVQVLGAFETMGRREGRSV